MGRIKFNTNSGGVGGGSTANAVQAQVEVGASGANDLIPAGTNLEEYIIRTRTTIFTPTLIAPSLSTSITGAANREVGTTINETVTLSFNRGQIRGKLVGGIWQPNTEQDKRSGIANNYTIDGVDMDLVVSKAVTRKLVLGANAFAGLVDYNQGPQPTDSAGANFSTPLVAGDVSDNAVVTTHYARFYGPTSKTSANITSADVRSLSGYALDNSALVFTYATGTVEKSFAIAVPDNRSLVSVIDKTNANTNLTNFFSLTGLTTINDNGGDPQTYKVYIMTNASAYSSSANHEVTIQ